MSACVFRLLLHFCKDLVQSISTFLEQSSRKGLLPQARFTSLQKHHLPKVKVSLSQLSVTYVGPNDPKLLESLKSLSWQSFWKKKKKRKNYIFFPVYRFWYFL